MIGSLLVLLGCGGAPAPQPVATRSGAEAVTAPPEEAPVTPPSAEGFAPTPFSAEQIRDAMPVGQEIDWRLTMGQDDPRTTIQTWRVTAADASTMTLEVGEQVRTTPWEELRDHARFPADRTTVTPGVQLELPLGTLETVQYVVLQEDGAVARYWFAPSLPGPPVRHESETGGQRTFHMEQIARRPPRDGGTAP